MAYPINNTSIILALSTEVFKISEENFQQLCFYSTMFKTFSCFKPDASNVYVYMCVCVCIYIYVFVYAFPFHVRNIK